MKTERFVSGQISTLMKLTRFLRMSAILNTMVFLVILVPRLVNVTLPTVPILNLML
jgi:hypothetical protein